MPESYRHYIPKAGLSIERFTDAVPGDGRYYLLRNGEIIYSFKSLKQAEQKFREILKEIDFTPEPANAMNKSQGEMHIERFLDAKDMYWAVSHKFRGRGGRGGRGGV